MAKDNKNKVSIDNWIKEQELNNLHKKEAVYEHLPAENRYARRHAL